jgi:hypothetical protein
VELEPLQQKKGGREKTERVTFENGELREVGSATQHTMLMNVHRKALHLFGLPIDRQGFFAYMKKVLKCCGCRSNTEPIDYTRLDLAIQAENRDLLGHEFVQRFLDKVWTSPSNARGLFSMSPRHKFFLHFASFAAFLVVFINVLLDVTNETDDTWQDNLDIRRWESFGNDGFEKIFWVYFAATFIDEIVHIMGYDFTTKMEQHRLGLSSIEEALPNMTNFVFMLAASIRATWYFREDWAGVLRPSFLLCLCVNMMLCFFRLISFMKYVVSGFGIMVVITKVCTFKRCLLCVCKTFSLNAKNKSYSL